MDIESINLMHPIIDNDKYGHLSNPCRRIGEKIIIKRIQDNVEVNRGVCSGIFLFSEI